MQPVFGIVVGYRAAVGQDQAAPLCLSDRTQNFVLNLHLCTVGERATFGQAAHQTPVSQGKRLAQVRAIQAVAPAYRLDRIVGEVLEVNLITLLFWISMDVHNIEPSLTRARECLEIVRAANARILRAGEVLVGCAHAGEEDAAGPGVDCSLQQTAQILGNNRQALLKRLRILAHGLYNVLTSNPSQHIRQGTEDGQDQRIVFSQLRAQDTNAVELLLKDG